MKSIKELLLSWDSRLENESDKDFWKFIVEQFAVNDKHVFYIMIRALGQKQQYGE